MPEKTVRAIEARRLVDSVIDRISSEGMPVPYLDASGDDFARAFDRWLVYFVDWLRAPSR